MTKARKTPVHTSLLTVLTVCWLWLCFTSNALLAQTPAASSNSGNGPITLNLKDADITTLINTVSQLTGKNFVVDPRVKGKVTVVSSHPMSQNELYEVFLSILDVHGFAAVPSNGVIKIIPDAQAKQTGAASIRGSVGSDEVVTRVIQVKNVSAAQLVPILRPLVPQQGHLAAYAETNVLIISDRAANVNRLARIIGRIDRASDSTIDIVPLQHASAAEVVNILNNLQQSTKQSPQEGVRLAADERTNSILLSGDPNARLRLRTIIGHLDTPLESGGNTHVIYLRYAKAKDLVPVLTGVSTTIQTAEAKANATAPQAGDISIQADETANALIITAPPDVYRSLKSVVSQLDIRRAQVLVEAIIAEVTLDKSKELGVQWIVDGTPGNEGPVGIINFGGSSGIGNIAATVAAGGIPPIPDGANIGGGQFNDNSVNFAVLLRALASDATTNILSTPSLLTLDNQEAEIVIGQNVPFVTGEFANTGSTTTSVNPFRTIQREDVGLTLRVTPQINEGDAIKLEIEQEVSSLSPSSVGATDVITNKRVIKTAVMVEDGQTIVLGGLIDDNLQETKQKVPVLGDIPLLGKLFQSQSTTKVKRNLMVFLRPIILRDAAVTSQQTSSKYNYLRAEQLKMKQQGVGLFADDVVPVLPEKQLSLPHPFLEKSEMDKVAPDNG